MMPFEVTEPLLRAYTYTYTYTYTHACTYTYTYTYKFRCQKNLAHSTRQGRQGPLPDKAI